jgi:hypothetical protein
MLVRPAFPVMTRVSHARVEVRRIEYTGRVAPWDDVRSWSSYFSTWTRAALLASSGRRRDQMSTGNVKKVVIERGFGFHR